MCAKVVGVFTVVEGQVTVLREHYYYAAAEGVEVEDQDLVESQADSTTQIEMVDGSTLRLGADSRLLLSEYDIDGDKSVVAASIDVLSGWLRFAVAKLKKNARYELNTPTLIIGVRGTEGVIEAGNEQAGILLEEGLVDVSTQGEEAALFPRFSFAPANSYNAVRGSAFGDFVRRRLHFARDYPLAYNEGYSAGSTNYGDAVSQPGSFDVQRKAIYVGTCVNMHRCVRNSSGACCGREDKATYGNLTAWPRKKAQFCDESSNVRRRHDTGRLIGAR